MPKHYYVSGCVTTSGSRRGFNVIEEDTQKIMTTVWGNTLDAHYIEAYNDAHKIAKALNLLEETENAQAG